MQQVGELRGEVEPAARDRADRGDVGVPGGVLRQVPGGTGLHGGQYVGRRAGRGDDQYRPLRGQPGDVVERRGAAGQVQVQDHEVGRHRTGPVERQLGTALDRCRDLHVLDRGQDGRQAVAGHRVVIDDRDPQHVTKCDPSMSPRQSALPPTWPVACWVHVPGAAVAGTRRGAVVAHPDHGRAAAGTAGRVHRRGLVGRGTLRGRAGHHGTGRGRPGGRAVRRGAVRAGDGAALRRGTSA